MKLDTQKLKLYTIIDASFANNKDLSSQIGYLIVIGNEISSTNIRLEIRGNLLH